MNSQGDGGFAQGRSSNRPPLFVVTILLISVPLCKCLLLTKTLKFRILLRMVLGNL